LDASTSLPLGRIQFRIIMRNGRRELVAYTEGEMPPDRNSVEEMLQGVSKALGSTVEEMQLLMRSSPSAKVCILFVIKLVAVTYNRSQRLLDLARGAHSRFIATKAASFQAATA
jgi:hypothetical protein